MVKRLVTSSTIILAATLLANLLAYLFHLYMGRALGPVGYGILGSVLAILSILMVPLSTVSLVITRFVSEFQAAGEPDRIGPLIGALMKQASRYGTPSLILLLLASPLTARFLQLPSYVPLAIVALGLLIAFVVVVFRSVLGGLQYFGRLGLNEVLEAVSRLLLGIVLVSGLGLGVNGSILSYFLAYLVAALVLMPWVLPLLRPKGTDIDAGQVYRYVWPTALMGVSLAIMANADLVLVKHFFDPTEAGHYAAVVALGRPIGILAAAMSIVLFPSVSAAWTRGERTMRMLATGMLYVGGLSVLVILAYSMFPAPITTLMFGSEYIRAAPLLGPFAVAVTLYSLIAIYVRYELAVSSTSFVVPLVAGAALEMLLLSVFHSSLLSVITALVLTYSVTMVCLLASRVGRAAPPQAGA
jgi:O-antigen/teichoic acid export membrane protein